MERVERHRTRHPHILHYTTERNNKVTISSTTINSRRNIERRAEFVPNTFIPRLPSHQPSVLRYPNNAAGRLLRGEDERSRS